MISLSFRWSRLTALALAGGQCWILVSHSMSTQEVISAHAVLNHLDTLSTLQFRVNLCLPVRNVSALGWPTSLSCLWAGLECVCGPGFWRTYEAVGGTLTCVACPPKHVTTEDGLDCTRCLPPLTFDSRTKLCSQCPAGSVSGGVAVSLSGFAVFLLSGQV